MKYAQGLEIGCDAMSSSVPDAEVKRQQERNAQLLRQDGSENILAIWKELGNWMTEHVTVVRYNKNLERTETKLQELQQHFHKVNLSDRTQWSNQTLNFARELENMLLLARVITLGALARDESRGAHYKPDFPERDDPNWLKTTRASWRNGKIELHYEPVDTGLIPLRKRSYTAAK